MIDSDGLTRVFATIKVTPDVHGLPANYQAVIEWARISLVVLTSSPLRVLTPVFPRSLASTVFHMFVASDSSSETFSSLKRIHGLMPYFVLKATLKISNPIAMIRSELGCGLVKS
jgi:hypothetical protein